MKLKLGMMLIVLLGFVGFSAPAMATGDFYYIGDEELIDDWTEDCQAAAGGIGPPSSKVHVVHSKNDGARLEFSDCTQSCSTGLIYCSSLTYIPN